MSLMQYTTVPDTTKVLKFHAAAAQVYSADLSSRTPMRSSDRADYTGLRVGQIDTAMMQDLKAFERRLTEVISCAKPTAIRWRIVLAVVTACTAIGAWQWINDPAISRVTFWDSLVSHPFFLVSFLILVLLFLFGVHSRIQAHIIIAERTKTVLEDFNMSCDNNGKLILRPTTAAT